MQASDRQHLAASYAGFLGKLAREELLAGEAAPLPLPPESELESLWADGLLLPPDSPVRVIDCGEWNRGNGPDFLRAELEIRGRRVRGDIEIAHSAEQWEAAGHGSDPRYGSTALHIVLRPLPPGWYTRDHRHRNIPVLAIPEGQWLAATGRRSPLAGLAPAAAPLRDLPLPQAVSLLKAAAARRIELKRERHQRRAAIVGSDQAWYEAFAATLGYSANKWPMQMLARRAPLCALGNTPEQAEAITFGTAGFLTPVLPERATDSARQYHRQVWDAWWPQRAQHELSGARRIPWVMAAGRPLNHPHRRVAALAAAAEQWDAIRPLLDSGHARQLEQLLGHLSHPYWDWHSSLPSAPLEHRTALIGKARIRELLVNHVYVQDASPAAWETYTCLAAEASPARVARTARQLFGERRDIAELLRLCFVQQGLLQLEQDCRMEGGEFPEGMARWLG